MFLQSNITKNLHNTAISGKAGAPRKSGIKAFARAATLFGAAATLMPSSAFAAIGNGDYVKDLYRPGKPQTVHYYRTRPYGETVTGKNTEIQSKAEIVPASLGGLARTLPTGIYTASASVTTSCFNPRMVSLLRTIQTKYRRPLIITSGYRSPAHNIRAGGVKGSLHMACAAADIKIPGVNKYSLASYVRSLPNRGGVGLYCHDAVHVDIGSPRQWNWCATGRPKRR